MHYAFHCIALLALLQMEMSPDAVVLEVGPDRRLQAGLIPKLLLGEDVIDC
jgi:hypothetical protein